MNIQYNLPNRPLRLILVNPLTGAGELVCDKLLRGYVLGVDQMIDLILLVYSNEVDEAEELKAILNQCGFPCNNSITITSNLPSLSDADIFIFITEFPNLNSLDFDRLYDTSVFDTLYLLLKVANNLEWNPSSPEDDHMISVKKRAKKLATKPRKPLIITDSLIALDVLSTFTKNLPKDIFFCPSTIPSVAKNVLAEYLKVQMSDLNRIYTWGANDDVFHVEVARPVLIEHILERKCDHGECDVIADTDREWLGFDQTQFNPAWMKKEYIDKIRSITSTHPNGVIYKCLKLTNLLSDIWKSRLTKKQEVFINCGVISDGSLHTYKGLPYVLPIILKQEDTFVIDHYNKDNTLLKREIDLMNKAVLVHHKKLIPYCNKFFERNVIQQLFLPKSNASLVGESQNEVHFGKSPTASNKLTPRTSTPRSLRSSQSRISRNTSFYE